MASSMPSGRNTATRVRVLWASAGGTRYGGIAADRTLFGVNAAGPGVGVCQTVSRRWPGLGPRFNGYATGAHASVPKKFLTLWVKAKCRP